MHANCKTQDEKKKKRKKEKRDISRKREAFLLVFQFLFYFFLNGTNFIAHNCQPKVEIGSKESKLEFFFFLKWDKFHFA